MRHGLTATGKSSSKRHKTCFWLLWAWSLHTVHIHTCRRNTHRHKIKLINPKQMKKQRKSQSWINTSYILLTSYSVYRVVSESHRKLNELNGNSNHSYRADICIDKCCDTELGLLLVTMVMLWWQFHSTRMLRPRREEQFSPGHY